MSRSGAGYRALFDVKPTDDLVDPINLRLVFERGWPAADGNLDLPVDPAVGEGPQGGAVAGSRLRPSQWFTPVVAGLTPLAIGSAGSSERDHVAPGRTRTTPPGLSTVTANAFACPMDSDARIGITTSDASAGTSNTPPSTG